MSDVQIWKKWLLYTVRWYPDNHLAHYFPSLKRGKNRITKFTMLYVTISTLNQLTDFHKIWHGHYTITGHPNAVPSNFRQLVITLW
jgi:hypothetical protein